MFELSNTAEERQLLHVIHTVWWDIIHFIRWTTCTYKCIYIMSVQTYVFWQQTAFCCDLDFFSMFAVTNELRCTAVQSSVYVMQMCSTVACAWCKIPVIWWIVLYCFMAHELVCIQSITDLVLWTCKCRPTMRFTRHGYVILKCKVSWVDEPTLCCAVFWCAMYHNSVCFNYWCGSLNMVVNCHIDDVCVFVQVVGLMN